MRNQLFKRVNLTLLTPSLILVFISLTTLYSIDISFFRSQAVFFAVSIVAYFLFLHVDYHLFRLSAKLSYIIMLLLLGMLFLIGIEAKGAVRWIDLFGVRIQFAEIIKPFFIIFLADFLTKDESRSLKKFLVSLILVAPIFFLILKEPDLGNAIIYFFTAVFMFMMYGFPFKYFFALFVSIIVPLPFIFNFLHEYQKSRILTFLNLTHDPFGSSYNAIQSVISVGSGGIIGKGFGQATQSILRFLPERHTDFIFATICESLGFIGGIAIISLFIYFLYNLYKIAGFTRDTFSHLVISGFYFLFFTHVFFNIGMNIGILPIVGITLPFVSYGGSSLLTSFISLGIVSSMYSDLRKKHSIEIR